MHNASLSSLLEHAENVVGLLCIQDAAAFGDSYRDGECGGTLLPDAFLQESTFLAIPLTIKLSDAAQAFLFEVDDKTGCTNGPFLQGLRVQGIATHKYNEKGVRTHTEIQFFPDGEFYKTKRPGNNCLLATGIVPTHETKYCWNCVFIRLVDDFRNNLPVMDGFCKKRKMQQRYENDFACGDFRNRIGGG